MTCTASSSSTAPAADHVAIVVNFLLTHVRYHPSFAQGKAGTTPAFTSSVTMPRAYVFFNYIWYMLIHRRYLLTEYTGNIIVLLRSNSYTHNSLFGSRDLTAGNSTLCFPDSSEIRIELGKYIGRPHARKHPMKIVEQHRRPCGL